jgi:NAD(P)H-flavin reductase
MNTAHSKQCLSAELLQKTAVNTAIFRLDFEWAGPPPRAGQCFMVKPERSGVFLARPISAALWEGGLRGNQRQKRRLTHEEERFLTADTVRFLIARRGPGTEELAAMRTGERAELSGPLGNAWADFLPDGPGKKPIALVSGGIGIAPLQAFAAELSPEDDQTHVESPAFLFNFYAGFKTLSSRPEEKASLLGPAWPGANRLLIATEDGSQGEKGRVGDFLRPQDYAAVYACGPEPMLKAVAASCAAAGTPCFVSMERRMACGSGACLGCTVQTIRGNRRCCADGPIFNAEELICDA